MIVGVRSVLSWLQLPSASTSAASKAAVWSLTNAAQGTLVVGAHLGFMDTGTTAGLDVPEIPPAQAAAQTRPRSRGCGGGVGRRGHPGANQLPSGPPVGLVGAR
ncbi:hypothetical protein SAMN05443637_10499 [Pseudonocardia thermophila]|uniref:Uncharacterized protein n=1 Tax=Pseudonocardia thermophila TaxID=1848 RepID=A0A1M6QZN5_PSETH|nr:hypothetical protein SAMN05443637_10499 [Pseudonocardia thermophila]